MEKETTAGCSFLTLLIFNLTLGGLCFDYSLYSIFGRDIPWYGDSFAGLFLGQFMVPIAVVCWILRMCGIEAPFFH